MYTISGELSISQKESHKQNITKLNGIKKERKMFQKCFFFCTGKYGQDFAWDHKP